MDLDNCNCALNHDPVSKIVVTDWQAAAYFVLLAVLAAPVLWWVAREIRGIVARL